MLVDQKCVLATKMISLHFNRQIVAPMSLPSHFVCTANVPGKMCSLLQNVCVRIEIVLKDKRKQENCHIIQEIVLHSDKQFIPRKHHQSDIPSGQTDLIGS